jgi:hypothetical protein
VSAAVNNEAVQRSRLRVDARKWLMSKLMPKKYGEKLELGGDLKVTLGLAERLEAAAKRHDTPAADLEQRLVDRVATFRTDPLGFVIFAFPWGEAGTALADAAALGIGSASCSTSSAGSCARVTISASSCRSSWRAPAATASASRRSSAG